MTVAVSVVVPTYQRKERLRRCLDALARQTCPPDNFEVVVVVDGSRDGTLAMLAALSTPYRLRTLWQANAGAGAARNRGAAAAAGRFLLFLDDDILAEPGLVAEHLRAQAAHPGVAVIGRITLSLRAKPSGMLRAFAEAWQRRYDELASRSLEPTCTDCYSGNLSVPRAAFQAIDGFATDLSSEDVELGFRLAAHGLSFVYAHGAAGAQDYRKEWRDLTADAEAQGRSSLELYRRHPELLPALGLGNFHDEGIRGLLLRRLLLALRVPVLPVAWFGRLAVRWRSDAWSRFVHRYAYWHGVRHAVADIDTWRSLKSGTAILMYHACGGPAEAPSAYVLPIRRFTRQMAWLKRTGYRVISLAAYLDYRRAHRLPPPRSVVITFDDGYLDTPELAGPVLRRHGFPATIFLVTGLLGDANRWDESGALAGRPLASWSEVEGGDFFSCGAHTRTHLALPGLPAGRLAEEVAGSRADLEQQGNGPVVSFAYPFGLFDEAAVAAVQRSGYQLACSTLSGVNDPGTPPLLLRRLDVRGTGNLLQFAAALWLGDSQPLWHFGRRG